MRCSRCGTEAKPGTKFCEGCGSELKSVQAAPGATGLRCTNCGTLSAANARFCEGCGKKIEWTAGPAPSQPAPQVRPAQASPPPVSPPMKCANCGTQSSPGVKFCEGCGAVLGGSVQAMPPQQGSFSKSLLLIPLLLLLGGGLGFFGYQRYRAGQTPPVPPEPLPVAVEEPPKPPAPAPTDPAPPPPAVTTPDPSPIDPAPVRPPVTRPVDPRPVPVQPPPQEPAPVVEPPKPQLPAITTTPAPEPAKVPILRPDRDEPAPPAPVQPPVTRTPAEPVQPAYNGPASGVIVWSGHLEKNGTVVIDGASASLGSLNGRLPGVPVSVNLDVREFAVAEAPSPSNGWSKLVFRSRNKRHTVVTIQWKVIN